MIKNCTICGQLFSRRLGEKLDNYRRRKTCGQPQCIHDYRCRVMLQVREFRNDDPEDWWRPIEPPDYNNGFAQHNLAIKPNHQRLPSPAPSLPATKSAMADL